MYLKRLYPRGDDEACESAAPKLKLLNVRDLWRVSPSALLEGVAAGSITLAKGRIILHGIVPGGGVRDIVFRIRRLPGLWCCHCKRPMASGMAAKKHILDAHPGAKSPDRNNPSGYEQLNAVECERE